MLQSQREAEQNFTVVIIFIFVATQETLDYIST